MSDTSARFACLLAGVAVAMVIGRCGVSAHDRVRRQNQNPALADGILKLLQSLTSPSPFQQQQQRTFVPPQSESLLKKLFASHDAGGSGQTLQVIVDCVMAHVTKVSTRPQVDDQLVNSCFQWLLQNVLGGRANGGADPFASVFAAGGQQRPTNLLSPASRNQLNVVDGPGQLSPDDILGRFSAEQRQLLQNANSGSNAAHRSVRDDAKDDGLCLIRNCNHHPDSYEQRHLRNVQILRQLQQRSPITPIRPATVNQRQPPAARSLPQIDGATLSNFLRALAPSGGDDDHFPAALRQSASDQRQLAPYLQTPPPPQSGEQSVPATLVRLAAEPSELTARSSNRTRLAPIVKNGIQLLSQLLQNGPDTATVVDTGGDRFDRFVVHNRDRVDALGLAIADDRKSKGLYWGDGNVQVVDEQSQRLFGQPVASTDHGFTLPLNDLVPADSPLRRLLNPDELRLLQRRLQAAKVI